MGQPVSGYEWKRVIAAGSATLKATPGVLHTVNLESGIGTVVLYDSASGTSSNIVASIGAGAGTITSLTYDAQLKRGLYYVATGTPSVGITLG